MRLVRTTALLLLAALALCQPAWAQDAAKTFSVLPFKVLGPDKYAYLGPAIQTMLASRLTWPGHFNFKDSSGAAMPASPDAALDSVKSLGVDYLIWGTVTVVGDSTSLDVRVMDKEGKSWPKSATVKMNDIPPKMEAIAQEINAEIFKRPGSQPKAAAQPAQVLGDNSAQQMNPGLIFNEEQGDSQQDFFLNPYFKYQANPDQSGRWKSQALPVQARSMVIGDLDGSGEVKIALLADESLSVYRQRAGMLEKLATLPLPRRVRTLRLSLVPRGIDNKPALVVSGLQDEFSSSATTLRDGTPWAAIIMYDGSKLSMVKDNIPMFLSSVQMPPTYRPMLLCQRAAGTAMLGAPVYQAIVTRDGIEEGARILTPAYGNVFDLGYLPTSDGDKILVANDMDKIRVNTSAGELIATTGDEYANSPVGFVYANHVAGLTPNSASNENTYWVPMRMIVTSLADPKKKELIVGRNISTAADYFANYRDFPYGEIHSLYWDGTGLSLIWKTRRLKGTVVDYAIADIDGDGHQELCVLLRTYTGTGGLSSRSVLEAYKLILEKNQGKNPELESHEGDKQQ
ncbi:hypothetical protein dsx2_0760 [Desulfovibrio sp. X2]|uniref:hypothetical protein n=1 Tax=Desulfovibrio sp. X2 TaxID=941449 RepID=UPI0003589E3F|nr:hypothetical protein [Desulfovibrio sp. X2]EPR37414.1 hypothetical protein dsx2_0760 [Desulfovibrio sp. X2]